MTTKEAFEAWASEYGFHAEQGDVHQYAQDCAWAAWQAALAAHPSTSPEGAEPMGYFINDAPTGMKPHYSQIDEQFKGNKDVFAFYAHPLRSIPVAEAVDLAELVNRFLCWPLPERHASDRCVSDPEYQFPRSGTNLLDANEAEAMLRYVLASASLATPPAADSMPVGLPITKDWCMRMAALEPEDGAIGAGVAADSTPAAGVANPMGYVPTDGPIAEWQVALQNALVHEYDRCAETHQATGKWDSFYMKIIGDHIARFPLLHAAAAPAGAQPPVALTDDAAVEAFWTAYNEATQFKSMPEATKLALAAAYPVIAAALHQLADDARLHLDGKCSSLSPSIDVARALLPMQPPALNEDGLRTTFDKWLNANPKYAHCHVSAWEAVKGISALFAKQPPVAVLTEGGKPASTYFRAGRNQGLQEAAHLAIQWGEARMPDNGGLALRNCANAIRALSTGEALS